MTLFTLRNKHLELLVSDHGGTIEGLWWQRGEQRVPILRPGKQSGIAVESSCFPLVPFGNRVRGNHFSYGGQQYSLQPNVDWDSHYLHGDGWLNQWQCTASQADTLAMAYHHQKGIYHYRVEQRFHLLDDSLSVVLEVTNLGQQRLPFGLGWHPYFPLTPRTRLQAQAEGYWQEEAHWLAGEYHNKLTAEYDFTQPAALPRHWVNNGFAGWDGQAVINWPETGCRLTLTTTPPAPCFFIFVSDPLFDPGYDYDFFCFEPMTHAPDDHHRPGGGHLKELTEGEKLQQTMQLRLNRVSGQ